MLENPMLEHAYLKTVLEDPSLRDMVDQVWNEVGESFRQAQRELPADKAMPRTELSFHEQVKFLGYLCLIATETPGDIIEIGVWKGKSLCFMNRICEGRRRLIGVDPMELPRQVDELGFYHQRLFPEALLIRGYSEFSVNQVHALVPRTALLHIDGGHQGRNVLLDFLLYAPTVVPGGFVVFDDYADYQYSPEVGPAVDLLRAGGYFAGFHVLGSVSGYPNSYLLQKK